MRGLRKAIRIILKESVEGVEAKSQNHNALVRRYTVECPVIMMQCNDSQELEWLRIPRPN